MSETPLLKMVMYTVELGLADTEWRFTDESIRLAGCSVNSFYRAISTLTSRGFIRRTTHGTYESRLQKAKSPMNYKYHRSVVELALSYKEKLLLLTITSFINRAKEYCWVADKTLQKLTSMTSHIYRQSLWKLIELGFVKLGKMLGKKVFVCPFQIIKNEAVIPKIQFQITKNRFQITKNGVLRSTNIGETTTTSMVSKEDVRSEHIINTQYNTLEQGQGKLAGTPTMIKALSAKEVIELAMKKKAKVKKSGGKALLDVWKNLLGQVCDLKNMSDVHVTLKQQGQLNHLAKALGSQAEEIFTLAMTDWKDLVVFINDALGIDSNPSLPNIGYMTANAMYLQMYHGKQKEPLPVKKFEPKPMKKKLTLAEIMEKAHKDLGED